MSVGGHHPEMTQIQLLYSISHVVHQLAWNEQQIQQHQTHLERTHLDHKSPRIQRVHGALGGWTGRTIASDYNRIGGKELDARRTCRELSFNAGGPSGNGRPSWPRVAPVIEAKAVDAHAHDREQQNRVACESMRFHCDSGAGRVFQRRCSQYHCSGWERTMPSTARVTSWVSTSTAP